MNHPIKFQPIFKERIWGSDRLRSVLGKDLPPGKAIGESWELADLPADCSTVAQGPFAGMTLRQLLQEHGAELGFTPAQCKFPFVLLIKFLDANDVLSVQVHPDALACENFPEAKPKTECWYVLQAEPDSVIYRGLKPDVSSDDLRKALEQNHLADLMEVYPARKGDFHYLPAGTIHALGAGVMVAEIQTPSDTTYRLYDWDRRDQHGNSRPLHVDEGLACIHFSNNTAPKTTSDNITSPPTGHGVGSELAQLGQKLGQSKLLLECPFFAVAEIELQSDNEQQFTLGFPVVMIVLHGNGQIDNYDYNTGDTLLLGQSKKRFIKVTQPSHCLLVCLGSKKI